MNAEGPFILKVGGTGQDIMTQIEMTEEEGELKEERVSNYLFMNCI